MLAWRQMKADRLPPFPVWVLAAALLSPAASFAQARPNPAPQPAGKAPAQAQGQNVLRDRIVAVVDEDPILESEINRAIALGLHAAQSGASEGESESALRRRVLNSLIEDRLRLHEIDRFGFAQVAVEDIERRVAEIRGRFPSEEEFQKTLRQISMGPRALRQLVARQLMVLTYVEERLGPRVFVSLEDINEYYRTELTPAMQRAGQSVPPIDEVREDIRLVLKERKLNRELERWTQELRREADVNIYFDRPDRPLPPVVERVEKKGEKKPGG